MKPCKNLKFKCGTRRCKNTSNQVFEFEFGIYRIIQNFYLNFVGALVCYFQNHRYLITNAINESILRDINENIKIIKCRVTIRIHRLMYINLKEK